MAVAPGHPGAAIGAIILVDQYLLRPKAEIDADWRGTAFLAWGAGSIVAFLVEETAPFLSTAISAAVVAAIAYWLLSQRGRATA